MQHNDPQNNDQATVAHEFLVRFRGVPLTEEQADEVSALLGRTIRDEMLRFGLKVRMQDLRPSDEQLEAALILRGVYRGHEVDPL